MAQGGEKSVSQAWGIVQAKVWKLEWAGDLVKLNEIQYGLKAGEGGGARRLGWGPGTNPKGRASALRMRGRVSM